MASTTITIPTEWVDGLHFAERNWKAFILAIIACIVVSALGEVYKRLRLQKKFNLDIEGNKTKFKRGLHIGLGLISSATVYFGYVAEYAHNLLPAVQKWPQLASIVLMVYGGANFLYNLGLSKGWVKVSGVLSSLVKTTPKTVTPVTAIPLVDLPQQTPVVASEDQL